MTSTPFRELLVKNSKEIVLQVLSAIEEQPSRMEELMECFFDENLRLCQYASWPAGMIADHNPERILPYLGKNVK